VGHRGELRIRPARRGSLAPFRKDLILEVTRAGQLVLAYSSIVMGSSEVPALPARKPCESRGIQHIKLENEGWEAIRRDGASSRAFTELRESRGARGHEVEVEQGAGLRVGDQARGAKTPTRGFDALLRACGVDEPHCRARTAKRGAPEFGERLLWRDGALRSTCPACECTVEFQSEQRAARETRQRHRGARRHVRS